MSRLPIRLTVLSEAAADDFGADLEAPGEAPGTLADDRLDARLCQLEQKINQLLLRAGIPVETPVSQTDRHEVELSGSGMRVQIAGRCSVGDRVRVELALPEENGRPIKLLARVVSVTPHDGARPFFDVALVFVTVRDRDREAIVRHAYEVQRLELGRASNRVGLR